MQDTKNEAADHLRNNRKMYAEALGRFVERLERNSSEMAELAKAGGGHGISESFAEEQAAAFAERAKDAGRVLTELFDIFEGVPEGE